MGAPARYGAHLLRFSALPSIARQVVYAIVVYEEIGEDTIYSVTAYGVEGG